MRLEGNMNATALRIYLVIYFFIWAMPALICIYSTVLVVDTDFFSKLYSMAKETRRHTDTHTPPVFSRHNHNTFSQ